MTTSPEKIKVSERNTDKQQITDPVNGFTLHSNPDDNVGLDDDCIVAPHAESTRMNTGAPCNDGRDGK